jgi:uncharacterized protein
MSEEHRNVPTVGASLEEKVQALRSSAAYDDRPRSIATIETHYAWIFLANQHAYKLKKPVCTAYLDLSALPARLLSCTQELRLNQKLAPGVYQEVLPLVRRSDGALHAGGAGPAVDWLVKMRRLPASLMLDQAAAAGTVRCGALAAVGRVLAYFYATQPRMHFTPDEYVLRLAGQTSIDREDLLAPELGLAPALVEAVANDVSAAGEAMKQQLALRAQQARIVEAHGDLRPEHICLSEPPSIIDSLEFSRDLRMLDPAEELAFLHVECARAGYAWAAQEVFEAYRNASADPISSALVNFYRSRRAMTRAKLLAWHLRDPQVSGLADWNARARSCLQLAQEYARQARA